MNRKFKYRLDRRTVNLTIVMTDVLVCIISGLYLLYEGDYISVWFASIVIAIMALSILSIPRHITVTDKTLEIHCILDLTVIQLEDIEQIHPINRRDTRFILPMLGGWGFLGYYGRYFDWREFEMVKVYCSEWDNLVEIVDSMEQRYIVSCDHAEELIEAVNQNKSTFLYDSQTQL